MNNIRDHTQKEILNSINSPCHGLLNLAPRVGKTFIALQILKREKVKSVLWVTPFSHLRDTDIPNEFIKWKCKTLLSKTKIVCYKSLGEVKGKFDVIILDRYLFN